MKLKYDSSKVDRSKDVGTPPKPGTYKMKIAECNYEKESSQGERLVFVLRQQTTDAEGAGKGYGYWDYVAIDTDWKIDQYLQAIGVDTENKPKGTIDTTDFLNKIVMGRVKADSYEGEYRPKLARVLPYIEGDDDEEGEDDDFDDYGDEEGEEAEDDFEGGDDEEGEDEEEDVLALGVDADEGDEDAASRLQELCDENDVDPNEFETWEEAAQAVDKILNPPPPPRKKAAAKKAPAKKAAAKKTAPRRKPDPEPEEEPDAEDDYDTWSVADLRAELESRELKTGGSKSALIARLRASDADPF